MVVYLVHVAAESLAVIGNRAGDSDDGCWNSHWAVRVVPDVDWIVKAIMSKLHRLSLGSVACQTSCQDAAVKTSCQALSHEELHWTAAGSST